MDYSAFNHLWRSIIPISTKNREQSLMLMLSAYFDESGTDKSKDEVLTVAGYLSTVQRWEKFEVEWVNLLTEFDLECSHTVDMAHWKGGFSKDNGWDEAKRIEFSSKAHQIINANTMKAFDVSLYWADYNAIVSLFNGRDIPPAYAVLVNSILLEVGKWATENNYYEPIHYIFEQGVDDQGWVSKAYAKSSTNIASGGAFHLASLTFAEGKRVINGVRPIVQLQAADMNAYEICKARKDQLSGRLAEQGKHRASLDSLRRNDREVTMLYKDGLLEMVENILKEDESYEKEN